MRDPLMSHYAEDRNDALRPLIRRLMSEHDVTIVAVARALDYRRQTVAVFLTDGERPFFNASDIPALDELLGAKGALLSFLARSEGYSIQPLAAGVASTGDVLSQLGATMGRTADLVSVVTAVIEDGITPSEYAQADAAIVCVERKLGELRARLSAGVVGDVAPPVSLVRR